MIFQARRACYTERKGPVFDSTVQLDHPYIDEHNLAERFVRGSLSAQERKLFEKHYVDCQECMDRVALAQIFQAQAAIPKPVGLFTALATFTPRQQLLIFAAWTLALLLMPIGGMNWIEHHATAPQPEPEPVIWLPESGAIEARIPAGANWVSIATAVSDPRATYRLSIVDVADRPIMVGPDQRVSKGTAIALRLPSLPANVNFVVLEKKAENGAYTRVSRHPLTVDWR